MRASIIARNLAGYQLQSGSTRNRAAAFSVAAARRRPSPLVKPVNGEIFDIR